MKELGRSECDRLSLHVGDHPVLLTLLDRLHSESQEFAASQSAANQHREHGPIALFAKSIERGRVQKPSSLFRRQPVPNTHTQAPDALDAPNASREFRAEEPRISGLVRN